MNNLEGYLKFNLPGRVNDDGPVLQVHFTCDHVGTWHMIPIQWVSGIGNAYDNTQLCGTGAQNDNNTPSYIEDENGVMQIDFPLRISLDGEYFYTPPSLDQNTIPGFYLHLDTEPQGIQLYIQYKFWVNSVATWSDPVELFVSPILASLPELDEWSHLVVEENANRPYEYDIQIIGANDDCILLGTVETPYGTVEYLDYPVLQAQCEKWVMIDGMWEQVDIERVEDVSNISTTFSIVECAKEFGLSLSGSYKIIYYFELVSYNSQSLIEARTYEVLVKDIFAYDLYEKREGKWLRPLLKDNITEAPLQPTGDKFYFKVYDEELADFKWAPIEEIIWNPDYNPNNQA